MRRRHQAAVAEIAALSIARKRLHRSCRGGADFRRPMASGHALQA